MLRLREDHSAYHAIEKVCDLMHELGLQIITNGQQTWVNFKGLEHKYNLVDNEKSYEPVTEFPIALEYKLVREEWE